MHCAVPEFPTRYLPTQLGKTDRVKQLRHLRKSRKLYKKTNPEYYTRPRVQTFRSRPSHHVRNAMETYGVDSVKPSRALSRKTGCSVRGLRAIVKKGEGAYYSSGSRPNQTPQSWGYARLASAITGANASVVDYSILKRECAPRSRALRLATALKTRKKHI